MARVHVGHVARSHGLKGELKLSTFDHDAPSIREGIPLYLGKTESSAIPHPCTKVRHGNDALLVVLSDVTTREAADALKGLGVFVDEADLPDLDDGEHWAFQLKGALVKDESGAELGTIDDVTGGTAHDFLVVKTARGTHEVPLVEAFVVDIDDEARVVTLRTIPGLLGDDDDDDDGAEEA